MATDYVRYASTLDHEPRTFLGIRLGFRLTERAQAKLERRRSGDAYKAAARATSAPMTCLDCGGGTASLTGLNTALSSAGQGKYRHADKNACAFVRYRTRPWMPAQLIKRLVAKFR